MFNILNIFWIFILLIYFQYVNNEDNYDEINKELTNLVLNRIKRYEEYKKGSYISLTQNKPYISKEMHKNENIAKIAPFEENWEPGDPKEVDLMAKRGGYKESTNQDESDEDGIDLINTKNAGIKPRDCKNTKDKIWDQWGEWSACTVTCGIGLNTRWRHCVSGTCASGEKEAQIRTCTFPAC